jgi:hypothetical protein
MSLDEAVVLYKKEFGEEPVFKGRAWNLSPEEIAGLLLEAVKSGVPYHEEDFRDDEVG